MKTLYVSDLDGTLLQSNERTSDYTNMVINKLTDKGMLFSYATARSLITAKKAAKGINAKIPLIVYNGAFIIDNVTGEILKVIRELAEEKMTMVVVTHEMAFARDLSDRIIFMDGGVIVEQGNARDLINNPQNDRTRAFLSKY